MFAATRCAVYACPGRGWALKPLLGDDLETAIDASGSVSPAEAVRADPLVRRVCQEAVGLIRTGSFFASFGSGIVTSTTPSCVFALIFLASTPTGSAIEREKDP